MSRTAARSLSRGLLFLAAAAACAAAWAWAKPPVPESVTPAASESTARKLHQIREAHETGGSFGTVRISEQEANSYLAYDLAYAIPAGVSDVSLQFQPGRVSGTTLVDFDRLKEGLQTPPHPIADYFLRGVHRVGVEGSARGADGTGEFLLERVLLDGVELPQIVIDYLIEQYVRPSYPNAAINRAFPLPFSIDGFRAGTGYVALTGKQ